MNALTRPRILMSVAPPPQPDVELYETGQLGEVVHASPTGHCHHSTSCLAPLRVGELVVPVGSFYALLDHVEHDSRGTSVPPRLTGGGVPKRL